MLPSIADDSCSSNLLARLLVAASLVTAACGGAGDSSAPSASTTTGAGGSGGHSTATGGAGGEAAGGSSPLYEFESRFEPGSSSVNYSGQALRHVLVRDLDTFIGTLTQSLDDDTFSPADVQTTVAALEYFYAFDSQTAGSELIKLTTTPVALQKQYDDIATGKNLKEKLAGNDSSTDHRDWATEFVGWSDETIAANGGSVGSPEGLLQAFFGTLGKLALDRENGIIPNEPGSNQPLTKAFVTGDGLDLQQLIEKHLLMSVAYSQATDDYLDDEPDDVGKGLLSPNTRDGSSSATVLEHAWDEAFGYFGAARDYALYSDDELAAQNGRADWQGQHDTDGDGFIDLTREYVFGAASTAAKRDLGAVEKTDFTGEAFEAARAGRALIHAAGETLTEGELKQLKAHRDAWVEAWERALAATVVHELNEVIELTEGLGTPAYDFYEHAQEWSELKGYALGLQYNPRSRVKAADFAKLHELIGDRPVLVTASTAEREAYIAKLKQARALLGDAFGFATANLEAW